MAKRRRLDIKKILAANPGINAQQVAEALEILQKLHTSGVRLSEYNLTLPFSKSVHVGSPRHEDDPRTVHLGRH